MSAGAAVTETLFALGAGGRVVGVDSSSEFPAQARGLPKVGYARQLSAEGVLSLAPNTVLATTDAGPPAALQQLRSAGVSVVLVSNAHGSDAAIERIQRIGAAVNLVAEARALAERVRAELARVRPAPSVKRRVLFVYARGGATLNVAGRASAADAMLTLAGAENAVRGYEGYRPLTAEALVSASPDVLLMTERGLASVGGVDGALRLPGVALTPAGRARAVVAMEDLRLLGFGPRLGLAVAELARLIDAAPSVS